MMAARDEVRRLLAEGMKQTDIASELSISAGRVSQLVKELRQARDTSPSMASAASPKGVKKENRGKPQKKALHPHDGRRQNKGTPPPGPHSTGFKPGNAAAVTTGEFVNPFLSELFPEEDVQKIGAQQPATEVEALDRSIQLYEGRLTLQLRRLRKMEEQRKSMVTFETSYTRQEGDGEMMGSGRIATRKRRSVDEEIRRQHAIIDRTQRLYDSAIKAKHEMLKAQTPGGVDPKVYLDALNATAEEVWGDQEDRDPPEGQGEG